MLLAIDIGGTKTFMGIFDTELKSLKKLRTPKDLPLWKFILGNIDSDVDTISIATMGPLVISEGKIINNPHLPTKNQELARPLMEVLGRPVYIINDASAGAWAEYKAYGCQDLVYVAFGTGIGVGVIVDGHLLLGKDGNAHEFGHVTLDLNSSLICGCGGKGHAEALLGGNNLPKLAASNGIEVDSSAKFFEEIYAGNKTLYSVFRDALLSFISSLSNAYDPECIVLGGGVFEKHKELYMNILRHLNRYEGIVVRVPKIKPAKFGELSALYGAAFLAVDKPKHWISKLTYLKTNSLSLD